MKKLAILLLLLTEPLLALDCIQNVPRSFIIESAFVSLTDATIMTSLTPTSFTIKAYKKNKAPVTVTAAAAVFASRVLTSDATNFADGETVVLTGTLDGTLVTETYRFETTLAQAYDVLIGASADATLDNFKCAVNDTGCSGEGTSWGTGTTASVLANATTNSATQQTLVANIPGTIANDFTTTETCAHAAFGGAVMSGGIDGIVYDANGYYWFTAPATLYDTLGDMLVTFTYTGTMVNAQKIRVVAAASNEANVQGNTATVQGVWDLPRTTAGETASSIGEFLANLDPVALTDTVPEPTIPLSATPSLADILGWLKTAFYNKVTVTNTTKTFYNDAGTALGTQTISDNGTTATQNKVAP